MKPSAVVGLLGLVAARARHRPQEWVWPVLGIVVAVAFAGAIATQAVISADQAARSTLRELSDLERTVRITWQGPVTRAASIGARSVLGGLDLGPRTEVTLLAPVRLSGTIVQPAAIDPLSRWLITPAHLDRCRPRACPMLVAGGGVPKHLRAPGIPISLSGIGRLRSPVPLGFSPQSRALSPLIVSGDPTGLDRFPALSSVYRVHSWLAEVPADLLHSWDLAAFEHRLGVAQAGLLGVGTQFGMVAPFDGLDSARAQAAAARRALLLAGGAAAVLLAVFVALAAVGLRRERLENLDRLRGLGATELQLRVFVAAEALSLSGAGVFIGSWAAIVASVVLAGVAGEPIGPVLSHGVFTPTAVLTAGACWIVSAAVISLAAELRSTRILDLATVAAIVGLTVGLAFGPAENSASAALLAPACCLAAGLIVVRATIWLLPVTERIARLGPLSVRLAAVGLARAPGAPAAAIAFTCIAVALGGFALVYRATLGHGAADQAAERVPLDALVVPRSDFVTPLELAPPSVWRSISRGRVFPVRRTEASYQLGSSTSTVPALGVPAEAVSLVHGWRSSDGSAPLSTLASRLVLRGPPRFRGPTLPDHARWLSLEVHSPDTALTVTADLRDPGGNVRPLGLGTAGSDQRRLRARVPPGRWELEALQFEEGTGLRVTNGHQNGESPAPATQSTAHLELGPVVARSGGGRPVKLIGLSRWLGVGAASDEASNGRGVRLRFQESGLPGVLRPRQPTDALPVPVLADRQTAEAADRGKLQMTIDNQPIPARVVGVVDRFPTLSGARMFVVADESVLAGALDAQLPGQGRPDELWIAGRGAATLPAALEHGPLAGLGVSIRGAIEHELDRSPVARGVSGTLLAGAAISAVLALLGLVLIVTGPLRDRRLEEDVAGQGLGPAAIRAQLATRLRMGGALGIVPGVGLSLLLDRLAVATANAAGTHPPVPPLIPVLPAVALVAWVLGGAGLILLVAWLATSGLLRERK